MPSKERWIGNPVSRMIKKRSLKLNQNYMCCFIGPPGTSKSYSAGDFCEDIDPTFNIKRVGFTAEEFLALVNSDLPPGSAIMWDECGVNLDARSFMTLMNKMTSYILQTYRHKNYITVFTVPNLKFIDMRARALFNAVFSMKSIDRVRRRSRAKLYFLDTNDRTGKTYYVRPRVEGQQGYEVLNAVHFKMPSRKFRLAYEKKKTAFTAKLNQDCLESIQELEAPKTGPRGLKVVVEEARECLDELRDRKGKFSTALIQMRLGVGQILARDIRKVLHEEAGGA